MCFIVTFVWLGVMASPHFRVLEQILGTLSFLRVHVLQVISDVEKNGRCGTRSGILYVCMSVCSSRPLELARGREGRRAKSLDQKCQR